MANEINLTPWRKWYNNLQPYRRAELQAAVAKALKDPRTKNTKPEAVEDALIEEAYSMVTGIDTRPKPKEKRLARAVFAVNSMIKNGEIEWRKLGVLEKAALAKKNLARRFNV